MTVYTYYPASETADIAGLVCTITAPEGNIIEYTYGTTGNSKGLPVTKVLKDGNTVVSKIEYEYNSQLQVSKEKTSVDIAKGVYAVKEYEYDKFNNVTKVKDFGTGSTAAVTISEYDKLSRKTAEYSPNFFADKSHGTLTEYYPSGKVKKQTDALGNAVYEKTNGETKRTSAYYANGQLARQTDALGNTTKYEYGYLNKLTKTYTPCIINLG